MLHHVSFSVRDPMRAASLVSELVGGIAVRAPSPPFPSESWFAIFGDEAGTLIELTPWGSVLAPEAGGIVSDAEMRPHSASHVLAGTPHSAGALLELAAGHGLKISLADAGLFKFVKVWVEDSLLLELLPPEFAPDYIECFGAAGTDRLDGRFRALEKDIARQIAAV